MTIAGGLTAECDPRLTRLALENLLGNAWKFTSNRERAHIEVGATEEDGQTWFYVRDDGAGFDMHYADSLFGAFQRLHRQDEFEGTGIGLATVQRIVHRHGGAIRAEGAVDQGATFLFTLAPPRRSLSAASRRGHLTVCDRARTGSQRTTGRRGVHDGAHKLAQLIDIARLQRTCDGLSAATGMVLAVLDPDGTILIASGWQDICTRFHRLNPETAEGCLESDRRINERLLAGMDAPEHISYKCANGLWDVAFPLLVDGQHVATVFTGQFFYDDDEIDVEAFRARARKLGLDEGEYLEALTRVPVLTHTQVDQTMSFLVDLVGMLSESGLNALRDRRAEQELQRSQEVLHAVLDAIPARVFWKDNDLRFLGANSPFARDAGYETPEEIIGKDDYEMAWRDQAELYRADDRAVLEGGTAKLLFEEPQTTPDGEGLTLLTSKVPLRDAERRRDRRARHLHGRHGARPRAARGRGDARAPALHRRSTTRARSR